MATKARRRRTRRKAQKVETMIAEPTKSVVNEFTAQHGVYRKVTQPDGWQKTYKVLRNLYPSIVDRWLAEGGPGFEEPQRRAIDHCRALWHRIGSSGPLVANLDWIGGGTAGRERGLHQLEALAQIEQYERRIPRRYWAIFENVTRFEMPAGEACSHMATRPEQQVAHAKNCVGFVASLIAQWRGF